MKRNIIILFVLMTCANAMAQLSQRFVQEDYYYSEGVRLYHEGHYEAAQMVLTQYKGDTYREQAAFYHVAAQFESRQKGVADELKVFLQHYPATVFKSEVLFMQGTLEVENQRFKQAFKYYDNLNQQELFRPHLYEFLFRKGYACLQLGKLKEASNAFQKLKGEQNPYTLQAKYYYAYCQYKMENYGKALPEFLAIEHTEAYKNIVPYYIIQIYYSQGQYDEVVERAEYLFSNAPDNQNTKELHRLIGEVYYREGDYNKAIQHLNEYTKLAQKDKEVLVSEDCYLLGISYYHTANYEKAIEFLNKVKINEKDTTCFTGNMLYHLGNAYQKTEQNEQAKQKYSAALRFKQTPELKEETFYNYVLTTYAVSPAFGESITAFTQFIEEYPSSKHLQEIYPLMTDAFVRSKNYSAALEAIGKIKKPSQDMLTTQQYLRYQLGNDAFLAGKYEDAKNFYNDCINHTLKGKDTYAIESYYWRAECQYRLKKYAEAETDFKTYLSKSTTQSYNNQQVHYNLGYVAFAQEHYNAAKDEFLEYIKKADTKSITYADALNRIGDCFYAQKNFAQAETYYAKMVATGASGADYATFQRGYCLGFLKRYADKINVMQGLVKTYPRSDYAGNALYEIARAELQRDGHEMDAIAAYDELLVKYPNSRVVRKAALEKGMVYYNLSNYEKAIEAYKAVIKNYPGSDEAYSALDGLQQAYVHENQVDEYLAYTKTLGKSMQVTSQEDSITYVAAENQYIQRNYQAAANGMVKYLNSYCPQGRYCTMAQYYLADAYYQLQQYPQALAEYKKLTQITGNPYMDEAIIHCAELAYDMKDYQTALTYFQKMLQRASTTSEINTARLGILRCANILNDYDNAINIATEIVDDITSDAEVIKEAQFYRAKSYIAQNQPNMAINDLQTLSTEERTVRGAEAKYLLAEAYYTMKEDSISEQVVMEMPKQFGTQHYWLARGFILLADIYAYRQDYFYAKQFLLSLQSNYPNKDENDEIQVMVKQRLQKLDEREKEQLTPNDNEDE